MGEGGDCEERAWGWLRRGPGGWWGLRVEGGGLLHLYDQGVGGGERGGGRGVFERGMAALPHPPPPALLPTHTYF